MLPVAYELSAEMSGVRPELFEKAWLNYSNSTGTKDPLHLLKMYGVEATDLLKRVTVDYGLTTVSQFREVITIHGRCWQPAVTFYQTLQSIFVVFQRMITINSKPLK